MDFLDHQAASPGAPALIDAETGRIWSYGELRDVVGQVAMQLPPPPGVALVLVSRTVSSLVAYLATTKSGHVALPVDANLDPSLIEGLLERYRPDLIVGEASLSAIAAPSFTSYTAAAVDRVTVFSRISSSEVRPHRDLALLLSTSGSTGSPKLVRLAASNVQSNAEAIVTALNIDAGHRAVTSLAFSYSFGLSVIHSHLLAGASLLVSDRSIMSPELWDQMRTHSATSLYGVPYTYEMMRRVGFANMSLPELRMLAQAGGKLGVDHVRFFHELMDSRGGTFVPMYGQTEATARIAVLRPGLLPAKLGSAGLPIPGGHVEVQRLDGSGVAEQAREEGELVYKGPNVMMGYAERREDLERGDEMGGVLRTGDVGFLDEDGCIFINGRLKRFAKLYGFRVNLDEIEGFLEGAGPVAAVDAGDRVAVCCLAGSEKAVQDAITILAKRLQVNVRSFTLRTLDSLPRLPNGKTDYRTLAVLVGP